MAYNPGISYRGDQYISAGISDAADSVSKYFRNKRAEEDELEMQRGVLLGRYGSDGQFGGSEKLGEPAGAAGEPGYGGAPMNQADAGVAEQLGESAGAAGEPGASSGGIFGMFGRSNRPTAPAKTKATDSQTAESKGFKGLQAFASSEYNIPVEATTAMSKNALKGFLVGLDQRRTAEGQAQDRARQERQAQSAERLSDAQINNYAQDRALKQQQFVDQQKLTGAQINNYASLDQDRVIRQLADADQLRRDLAFESAMQPVPESGALNRFAMMPDASTLAPGTLDRYAGAPPELRDPNPQEILRSLVKYGPSDNRARYAKMLLDSQEQAVEQGPPKVTMLDGMDGNRIPFISWNNGRSGQIDPGYGAGLRSAAQQEALAARGEQRKILTAGELLKSYEAELKGLDNVMSWMGTTPEQRALHRSELQSKMEALRGGVVPAAPAEKPATKPAAEKPASGGDKPDVTPAEYEKLKSGDLFWWKGKQLPKR